MEAAAVSAIYNPLISLTENETVVDLIVENKFAHLFLSGFGNILRPKLFAYTEIAAILYVKIFFEIAPKIIISKDKSPYCGRICFAKK